jgi:hypothetical protein
MFESLDALVAAARGRGPVRIAVAAPAALEVLLDVGQAAALAEGDVDARPADQRRRERAPPDAGQATGSLKGDSQRVQYNLIVELTDLQNTVYTLMR